MFVFVHQRGYVFIPGCIYVSLLQEFDVTKTPLRSMHKTLQKEHFLHLYLWSKKGVSDALGVSVLYACSPDDVCRIVYIPIICCVLSISPVVTSTARCYRTISYNSLDTKSFALAFAPSKRHYDWSILTAWHLTFDRWFNSLVFWLHIILCLCQWYSISNVHQAVAWLYNVLR